MADWNMVSTGSRSSADAFASTLLKLYSGSIVLSSLQISFGCDQCHSKVDLNLTSLSRTMELQLFHAYVVAEVAGFVQKLLWMRISVPLLWLQLPDLLLELVIFGRLLMVVVIGFCSFLILNIPSHSSFANPIFYHDSGPWSPFLLLIELALEGYVCWNWSDLEGLLTVLNSLLSTVGSPHTLVSRLLFHGMAFRTLFKEKSLKNCHWTFFLSGLLLPFSSAFTTLTSCYQRVWSTAVLIPKVFLMDEGSSVVIFTFLGDQIHDISSSLR
ncbi:hypothetical protein Dimus_025619 [Dionaea muscipula]